MTKKEFEDKYNKAIRESRNKWKKMDGYPFGYFSCHSIGYNIPEALDLYKSFTPNSGFSWLWEEVSKIFEGSYDESFLIAAEVRCDFMHLFKEYVISEGLYRGL